MYNIIKIKKRLLTVRANTNDTSVNNIKVDDFNSILRKYPVDLQDTLKMANNKFRKYSIILEKNKVSKNPNEEILQEINNHRTSKNYLLKLGYNAINNLVENNNNNNSNNSYDNNDNDNNNNSYDNNDNYNYSNNVNYNKNNITTINEENLSNYNKDETLLNDKYNKTINSVYNEECSSIKKEIDEIEQNPINFFRVNSKIIKENNDDNKTNIENNNNYLHKVVTSKKNNSRNKSNNNINSIKNSISFINNIENNIIKDKSLISIKRKKSNSIDSYLCFNNNKNVKKISLSSNYQSNKDINLKVSNACKLKNIKRCSINSKVNKHTKELNSMKNNYNNFNNNNEFYSTKQLINPKSIKHISNKDFNANNNNIVEIVNHFDNYISLISTLNNTFDKLNDVISDVAGEHKSIYNKIHDIDERLKIAYRKQNELESKLGLGEDSNIEN